MDSLRHEPSDIRVAVVDTGITKDHPLLSTHVVQEHSFVTIENGFEEDEPSTADSKRTGHGTFVARQILEVFPQASIINAKVLTLDDKGATSTTYDAVAAAINWSVDVADADVINLSLGGIFWDSGVMNSVYHAWSQGVLVVCAAGNEQLDYTGNCVSYPSAYVPAISVAAMNPDGTLADYSSWGPASGRHMKPDIAAPAVFLDDQRSRGTSLATPWVSGAAAKLIALCDDLGVAWTPGMLKAALLRGASWSQYEDYQVGCGILDIDESLWLVRQAEVIDGVPLVCCITPSSLPLEFDRVFVGCPYQFHLTVTCSIESEYMVHVKGNAPSTLNVTRRFIANQSALYEVKILVPENSSSTSYDFDLLFEAHGQNHTVSVEFDTLKPRAKIALDMCHRNPHTRQSIYGDYFHYYSWLTSELIAVTEIRDRAEFDTVYFEQFDALFLLDTWINNDTYYGPDEVVAIEDYYKQGGSVFIGPAYSGKYQNTTLLNSVVNWTGAFYAANGTRGNWNVTSTHELVYGLHLDYQSGLLIHANTSFITLGGESRLESGNALLMYRGTPSRLMIAGFGGMFGSHEFTGSTDLCQLAKRMTLWLCRLF